MMVRCPHAVYGWMIFGSVVMFVNEKCISAYIEQLGVIVALVFAFSMAISSRRWMMQSSVVSSGFQHLLVQHTAWTQTLQVNRLIVCI